VNAPILRLFVAVLVLFGLLAGFTSWWSVIAAEDLRENSRNAREVLEEQRTRRGPIRARDGTLIAGSVRAGGGTYARRYPLDELFAFPVGYSFLRLNRSGLEQSRNDVLAGNRDGDVGAVFESLRGDDEAGDEVRTTLDVGAQRRAYAALAGREGSVVAIEPRTGKVRVMASTPTFDPNRLRDRASLEGVSTLNRATQGRYAPGSTFKVVTATAAIDSGEFSPDSQVNGRSPKVISGAPLNNFANEQFGSIPLTQALTQSVNTVWAEVGERLGAETMQRYMERFGFYEQVPVDLPDGQRGSSGVRKRGPGLVEMTDPRVDVGRVAIGQGDLLVSPLQMAMVASAVANRGRLMRPTLTDAIVENGSGRVDDVEPEELSEVMSSETARQVGDMMANVVREGTGTAAALEGTPVAGKTGTAEKNVATRLNQPWFIGFAPRENPRIAIAVTIESSIAGSGGTVAAPVAKQVLEELIGR
jgi:peptidoglycan glycosyltransferase